MEKFKISSLIEGSYIEFEKISNDPYSGSYGVSLYNPLFNLNYTVDYHNYDFLEYPSSFFAALAVQEKPWNEKIEWISLEQDFKLEGICSKLGQVIILIYIEERDGNTKYERLVEDEISLGFGELKDISKKIDAFFNVKEHEKYLKKDENS